MSWKAPNKNAWQVKEGKPTKAGQPTWLVKCRHGHEKTNHGEGFALFLWHVSWKERT